MANSTFEDAVLPHAASARELAIRLTGRQEDGEDVCQEAILRAYRYFAGFRGGNGCAWLTAIVHNTFRTWRKRRDDIEGASGALPPLFREEPDLELRADVELAVGALPDPLRRVFDLRERAGLTYLEIGNRLSITVAAATGRAARARQRLQRQLAPRKEEVPA